METRIYTMLPKRLDVMYSTKLQTGALVATDFHGHDPKRRLDAVRKC